MDQPVRASWTNQTPGGDDGDNAWPHR